MFTKFRHTLALVRFSHSIFALPFALGAMLIAAHGLPPWQIIVKIVIAMVTARTMAMAFNRWLDAEMDARNPRTAQRHIPAGILSRHYVLGLAIAMVVVFVLTCFLINPLSFYLSPIAVLILIGYSFCKRFTSLSHFVLGLALGISPVGAWIAVTGEFAWEPVLACAAVILWVASFDIIYAIDDADFDKCQNLHSVVVKWGIRKSLFISDILRILMTPLLVFFGIVVHATPGYYLLIVFIMIPLNRFIGTLVLLCTGIWEKNYSSGSFFFLFRFGDWVAGNVYKENPGTLAQKANLLLLLNGLTGLAFLLGCGLSVL